jgi:transposase-like protein
MEPIEIEPGDPDRRGKDSGTLGDVVRSTVEETLNAMLDAEADRLCRAERYERTEARKDTRAGSYQRRLQTKAGEVTLKVVIRQNCVWPHIVTLQRIRNGDAGRRVVGSQ